MTIDEAIVILSALREAAISGREAADADALQLGIEAMKWYQAITTKSGLSPPFPLPGETIA